MRYKRIREGKFLERENRFVARAMVDGKEVAVHVKNTGRCRELLIPGVKVYLEESDQTQRKTKFDLVAVEKGKRLINMDSQIPNKMAEEWILREGFRRNIRKVKREVQKGESRLDLYVEYEDDEGTLKRAFLEVKGVTLEENGIARFPDAPTKRGIKHIFELEKCIREGYEAYLLFVIQMKNVDYFEPDKKIHADFARALKEAAESGVTILAYDSEVTRDSIVLRDEVEVRL